jgi:GNAT superfamily N-acetyltransferase
VQGPGAAARWREVFERLLVLHPSEPHVTLGVLGVDPAHQRRGIGGALLERWLADCDAADGARPPGVYLETDREENLRFYGRRGFAPVGTLELLGVRIWRLWREPRAVPPERRVR